MIKYRRLQSDLSHCMSLGLVTWSLNWDAQCCITPLYVPESAAHLHISSASPEPIAPMPSTVCAESVHTMRMHDGVTHVPLRGTDLEKKIQHCELVTKHSLVGYTILTRWRGPLDFLNLFFLPHLWNQDVSYLTFPDAWGTLFVKCLGILVWNLQTYEIIGKELFAGNRTCVLLLWW